MFDIIQSYFSIELTIAAVLCARKFGMREKRGILFFAAAACIVICSSLKIGGKSVIDYGFSGGLLFYLGVLVCIVILVWQFYITTFSQALIIAVAAYSMQHCASDFVWLTVSIAGGSGDRLIMNPFVYTMVRGIVFAAAYVVMYVFFVKNLRLDKEKIKNRYQWGAFSAAILMLVTVMYGIFQRSLGQSAWIGIHTYDAVCTIFAMMLLVYMCRNDILSEELYVLRQICHFQQEHYKLSKENIQLINVKCHDIRKYLSSLYMQETKMRPDDKFKREMERSIRIYDALVRTDNEALDVILTEKSLYCAKHHIRMTCMADGKLLGFIDEMDLYSLFGNLLDNAIESVQKIGEENKRVINLDVRGAESFLRIQVENYYCGEVVFKDKFPVTTKKDTDFHGFGFRSIQMVVDKYGGIMQIHTCDDIFSVNILIPLQNT